MKKIIVFLFCVAVSMTSVAQIFKAANVARQISTCEKISIAALRGTAQINRSLTNLNNNSKLTVPSVTQSSIHLNQVKATQYLLNKTKSSQKEKADPKLQMESLMRKIKDMQKQDQIYKDALEAHPDINCLENQ